MTLELVRVALNHDRGIWRFVYRLQTKHNVLVGIGPVVTEHDPVALGYSVSVLIDLHIQFPDANEFKRLAGFCFGSRVVVLHT